MSTTSLIFMVKFHVLSKDHNIQSGLNFVSCFNNWDSTNSKGQFSIFCSKLWHWKYLSCSVLGWVCVWKISWSFEMSNIFEKIVATKEYVRNYIQMPFVDSMYLDHKTFHPQSKWWKEAFLHPLQVGKKL